MKPLIIDSHTISVLHFDKGLVHDECGREWLTYGNPVESEDITKFDGKSMYSAGAGCIYLNDHVLFSKLMQSGEWTIDGWFYSPSHRIDSHEAGFCMLGALGGGDHVADNARRILWTEMYPSREMWFYSADSDLKAYIDISVDTWHHIAVVCYDGYLHVYLDGAHRFTTSIDKDINAITSREDTFIWISANRNIDEHLYYCGYSYYDEIRISDIARWKENFTPYTTPYMSVKKIYVKDNGEAYAMTPDWGKVADDWYALDDSSKISAINNVDTDADIQSLSTISPFKIISYLPDLANYSYKVKVLPNISPIKRKLLFSTLQYDKLNKVSFDTTITGDAVIKVAISNNGKMWLAYDTSDSSWHEVDITDNDKFLADGMNASDVGDISTDNLNEINTTGKLGFAYILSVSSADETCAVNVLTFDVNTGKWLGTSHMTDYNYTYPSRDNLLVQFMGNGDYKVNFFVPKATHPTNVNEKKLIDTGGQDIYVGCAMAEPVHRAVTLTVEE